MTTRIRDSERGEAPELEALQRRALDVWEGDRELLAVHRDALAIPRAWIDEGKVRVAVDDDGRALGLAVAVEDELDSIYVDPDRTGGGVGRLLVEDAAAQARRTGAQALHTTANRNSLAFYERVGFAATGEEVESRFGPGIRMRLDLK